ncbi:hypothetical protein QVD99_004890 [Batrachochytrium dendrobatidis]|nr:hypothetical protein QVD99_004890 [Batrachochytrium dendrobatidis]
MYSKSDLRPSSASAHSNHASASYIRLGTQQPETADDVKAKERNKYLPVHLQEVRDEHGRKRLHGAFTGGHSAGYYNTVGSKEGWQPSQFISSRSKRAEKAQITPESFMDEEDMVEFGVKSVVAMDTYDASGAVDRDQRRRNIVAKSLADQDGYGAIGPTVERIIQDLILPAESSIGDKLMRQMGWREGQGIGPRRKRKIIDEHGEDLYAEKYLFAPKDTTIKYAKAKKNVFGIGFNPYAQAQEFLHSKNLKDSASIDGQVAKGFGVGIFEDDDDISAYDEPSKPLAMTLIDDDEPTQSGSFESTKPIKLQTVYGQSRLKHSQHISSRSSLELNTKHYNVLGFHAARVPLVAHRAFVPPKPPHGYIPKNPFADQLALLQPSGSSGKHANLTADQRGHILGEENLKGPERSVFSYISVKEQDRLQGIIDQTSKSKADSAKPEKVELLNIPKDVALAALKGFMPFGNDLPKQNRYRHFLQVKAGLESASTLFSNTISELSHELLEFSKAAMIYRPLSSMMASRFTSAVDQTGVGHHTGKEDIKADQPISKVVYGIKTRIMQEWRPERLLCKRFNVPMPLYNSKHDVEKVQNTSHRVLSDSLMRDLREVASDHNTSKMIGTSSTGSVSTVAVENSPTQLTTTAEASNLEIDDLEVAERPSMDIFKAIFADSDEESNSDEDDKKTDIILASTVRSSTSLNPIQSTVPIDLFKPVFRSKKQRTLASNSDFLPSTPAATSKSRPKKLPFTDIYMHDLDEKSVDSSDIQKNGTLLRADMDSQKPIQTNFQASVSAPVVEHSQCDLSLSSLEPSSLVHESLPKPVSLAIAPTFSTAVNTETSANLIQNCMAACLDQESDSSSDNQDVYGPMPPPKSTESCTSEMARIEQDGDWSMSASSKTRSVHKKSSHKDKPKRKKHKKDKDTKSHRSSNKRKVQDTSSEQEYERDGQDCLPPNSQDCSDTVLKNTKQAFSDRPSAEDFM